MPQSTTAYNLRRPARSASLSGNPFSTLRKSKLSHDITSSVKPGTSGASLDGSSNNDLETRPRRPGSAVVGRKKIAGTAGLASTAAAAGGHYSTSTGSRSSSPLEAPIERRCQHCHTRLASGTRICDCVSNGQQSRYTTISGETHKGSELSLKLEQAAATQLQHTHQNQEPSAAFGQPQPQKIVAGRRAGRFAP